MTQFDTFLTAHDVNNDVRERLAAAGITSLREAYDRAAPDDLISIITSPGVMTQRDSVRLALHCVEGVKTLLTDERSRAVISLLHRWLDGPSAVTQGELTAASDAAAAAGDAARATRDAWYAAAAATVVDAARVARDAARAARDAAAAGDAARAARVARYAAAAATVVDVARATWDAAGAEQAAWIRENVAFETLHTN